LLKDDVFGYSQFAKLVDACGDNLGKLNALRNTLLMKYDEAVKAATHWKNKIAANSRKKWDKRSKEKARVASYFKKSWSDWEQTLKSNNAVIMKDNKPFLNLQNDESGTMAGVWLGDRDDWADDLAVYNFFGKKAKDIALEDFNEVLENWDDIRTRIEAHRDRLVVSQAKKEIPIPTGNPVESEQSGEQPQKQDAGMKTVSSIDDIK
jgi:hypothetical protein